MQISDSDWDGGNLFWTFLFIVLLIVSIIIFCFSVSAQTDEKEYKEHFIRVNNTVPFDDPVVQTNIDATLKAEKDREFIRTIINAVGVVLLILFFIYWKVNKDNDDNDKENNNI